MTDAEILAVFGGLIVGYWLVSLVLGRKDKKEAPPASRPAGGEQRVPPAAAPDGPAWHQVLLVSRSASLDEIKEAYKDLIRQYHPDKVATMGPELQALAEQKSKEINAAYQAALRERGLRA